MTEGPDVPFVDDCGHNAWEEVDCEDSNPRVGETHWERCRVCGLRRTVYIPYSCERDTVVYWWPRVAYRTEEEYR